MSIAYPRIKRLAALRLAQLAGNDQAELETSYTDTWPTSVDGAEIPVTAFKDLILSTEKELAQMIGNNPQHPARSLLYGRTANLTDLATIPDVDNNGDEFVGVFDSCVDASTNRPCTWTPTQTIADIVDGASTFFGATNFYYYNITGNFIRTTRSTVYLQGCVWDYATQDTAYDADGDSPLPEALEATWVDGVTARAAQVGWVEDKTGYYANLYQQGMQMFNNVVPNNIPLASQNVVAG